MQEEAGYEKQIYYLPLLFCFHGKNLRQHKPFLFLSSFRMKSLFFGLKAKRMYFDVIFLSLISCIKEEKSWWRNMWSPANKAAPRVMLPVPGQFFIRGGILSPSCVLFFLRFPLRTKNRLMIAFDSNKGPNLKVVKWCWKGWNGPILMHIYDKQCEIIQQKSVEELKHPDSVFL